MMPKDVSIDDILTGSFRRVMGYCPARDPSAASFEYLPRDVAKEVRQEKVRDLASEGVAREDIADRLRCALETIRRDEKALGLKIPSRMQIAIAARRERVKSLFQDGMIAPQIAEELRVVYSTITSDMKAMGLPRNGRRRPKRRQ